MMTMITDDELMMMMIKLIPRKGREKWAAGVIGQRWKYYMYKLSDRIETARNERQAHSVEDISRADELCQWKRKYKGS